MVCVRGCVLKRAQCCKGSDLPVHTPHQLRPIRDGAAHVAAEDKVEGVRVCPVALDIVDLEVNVRRDPFLHVSFPFLAHSSPVVSILPLRLHGAKVVPDDLNPQVSFIQRLHGRGQKRPFYVMLTSIPGYISPNSIAPDTRVSNPSQKPPSLPREENPQIPVPVPTSSTLCTLSSSIGARNCCSPTVLTIT